MAISKVKNIKVLGTRGLANSNGLILFNSNTFQDSSILDYLNIPEHDSDILKTPITLDNALSILNTITKYEEFPVINISEGIFKFNNEGVDILAGQGFNTMLFLESGDLLGYTLLTEGEAVDTLTDSTNGPIDLRRSYTVSNVNIILDSSNNSVRLEKDNINLLNNLPLEYNISDWSDIYLTDRDKITYFSNYNSRLSCLLQSEKVSNLITDGLVAHKNKSELKTFKLQLLKNLDLKGYISLDKEQIGYYKGEPVVYLWNTKGNYSIFSLTNSLSSVFSEGDRPKPITKPREGISDTEIYSLSDGEISYFSGQYLITKSNEIFDIDKQLWVTNSNGDRITSFIVDKTSLSGKIFFTKYSKSEYSYDNLIKDFPFLNNIYTDLKTLLLRGDTLSYKSGDWVVFTNSRRNTVTYTNFTKTIVTRSDEDEPFLIDDQVLAGKNGEVFTFYRGTGNYISYRLKQTSDLYNDSKVSNEIVDLSEVTNLIDLQKSLFGPFRRGFGPKLLNNGFKFIGSLSGVLYYRQGDLINYI